MNSHVLTQGRRAAAVLLAAIALLSLDSPACAESGDGLDQNQLSALHVVDGNGDDANDPKWLPLDSNLRSIFTDNKTPQRMPGWLSPTNPEGLRLGNVIAYLGDKVVSSSLSYADRAGHVFKVGIYVPHPRFYREVDSKLMEQLTALEPPKLAVKESRAFAVRETKGMLFIHQGKGCSALLDLPQRTKVQVLDVECTDPKILEAFTERLNFERLAKKLSS